jgi:hypothetical protein
LYLLHYEQPQLKKGIRDIGQNYKYVHFRSMPTKEAAVFCEDKTQLETIVKSVLEAKISNVTLGKEWFKIIAGETPSKSSQRIWETINKII